MYPVVVAQRHQHLIQHGSLEYPNLLSYECLRRLNHIPGHHVYQLPALLALSFLFVVFESIDCGFDLGAQVGHVESILIDDLSIIWTIPSQPVQTLLRSGLLQDDTDCIRETDGVVWRVGRQKEHFAFADRNISVFAIVYNFEEHRPAILVKPLGCIIDMEVGTGVGAADDLDSWYQRHQLTRQAGAFTMTVTCSLYTQ